MKFLFTNLLICCIITRKIIIIDFLFVVNSNHFTDCFLLSKTQTENNYYENAELFKKKTSYL